MRRALCQRILDRAGIRSNASVRIAGYGWVTFAEHASLEWLAEPSVSRETMVRTLTGALLGALTHAGATWRTEQ